MLVAERQGVAIMDLLIVVFLLAVATAILLALCTTDLRRFQLPNKLNLAFGILGLSFHLLSPYGFLVLQSQLLAAMVGAALFLGLRWMFCQMRHVEALGLGDVKFIAAAGLWVGLEGVFWVIAIAALSTIGWVAIMRRQSAVLSKRPLLTLRTPFGPGLAFATAAVFTGMLVEFL